MRPVPLGVRPRRLRPTQMTVGYREIEEKRRQWREADARERARILRRHVVPVVLGPKQRHYVVDHHHFVRALLEEDAPAVGVTVLANFAHLPRAEFWTLLDNSGWCHAYDAAGKRRALTAIPRRIRKLADDPYRSLAGALIRGGAIAKVQRPFAEFVWADFLRRRVPVGHDWEQTVREAAKLARGPDARHLPGWCGGNEGGL